MAQASERPAGEPVGDELTPELALVDPELAARARERLGNGDVPPRAVPDPVAEQVVREIPSAEASARPAPEPFRWRPDPYELDETPSRSRGRRFRRTLVVVVVALGAIAFALVAPSLFLEDEATSNETPTAVPDPSGAAGPEAPATDEASGPEAPAAGGPRSFGWVPVAGARHYHVAFYRGKEKIYETWPRGPRLVLQPQWTFKGRRFTLSPGQYRWVVRAGFGARRTGRYGPAVVDASLLVRR